MLLLSVLYVTQNSSKFMICFLSYTTKKVSSVCLPIIKKTRVRVVKENIQRVICSHCAVVSGAEFVLFFLPRAWGPPCLPARNGIHV